MHIKQTIYKILKRLGRRLWIHFTAVDWADSWIGDAVPEDRLPVLKAHRSLTANGSGPSRRPVKTEPGCRNHRICTADTGIDELRLMNIKNMPSC